MENWCRFRFDDQNDALAQCLGHAASNKLFFAPAVRSCIPLEFKPIIVCRHPVAVQLA